MRTEDMQLVTQTPNSYHQLQMDRTDRSQNAPDKSKALEGELIPPGMARTLETQKSGQPSPLKTQRPVEKMDGEQMEMTRDPDDQGPGAILDLMA